MNETAVKAPIHLWIVGILSLLWNAGGAFDYLATKLQLDFYMNAFTEEQLAYFYGFPAWVVVFWALGVWGAFFGSVALLMRKSWAVWLFGASIVGLFATTIYNFVLTNGAELMGDGATWFSLAIWVIALALFFYSLSMTKRQVLT